MARKKVMVKGNVRKIEDCVISYLLIHGENANQPMMSRKVPDCPSLFAMLPNEGELLCCERNFI
jgi:hypothetical protein